MIFLDADNTLPADDCDVWPTDMTFERADELLSIHRGHVECAALLVALLTLSAGHDLADRAPLPAPGLIDLPDSGLPAKAETQCVQELLDTLLTSVDTGSLLSFACALHEWRSTAEIYADPELAQRLRGPFDTTDAVDVPAPKVSCPASGWRRR